MKYKISLRMSNAGSTYGQIGHVPSAPRLGGAPHLKDIPLKKRRRKKEENKKKGRKIEKKGEKERI